MSEQGHLTIKRKQGESITINGDIRISVVQIGRNSVRLCVEAPRDDKVLRTELLDREPATTN